jgi:hypothetical protein
MDRLLQTEHLAIEIDGEKESDVLSVVIANSSQWYSYSFLQTERLFAYQPYFAQLFEIYSSNGEVTATHPCGVWDIRFLRVTNWNPDTNLKSLIYYQGLTSHSPYSGYRLKKNIVRDAFDLTFATKVWLSKVTAVGWKQLLILNPAFLPSIMHWFLARCSFRVRSATKDSRFDYWTAFRNTGHV